MTQTYQMLIDGAWVDASDGGTFTTSNPATGEIWATVPEATADDVDRAVRAAHRACYDGPWAQMTATQRGHCLRRLADLLAERSEHFGEVETRDTGKMLQGNPLAVKIHRRIPAFLRRCRRQGAWRDAADRQTRHVRLHRPRALGRDRRRGAVEQPDVPHRSQDRPGAGGGQHGGAQDIRICPGGDPRVRRGFLPRPVSPTG